jgi:membrane-associated protein
VSVLHVGLSWILHLDTHLDALIHGFGAWTYLILFAIIFCETGLVVTPFLPGDSLLFAAGAFAARGSLDLPSLLLVLGAAAVLGDSANYWAGALTGPQIFHREDVRRLNKRRLAEAHAFYERWGGVTIIIARFMPIIRTFAPFVAGIGRMSYRRFIAYNVIGGLGWIALLLSGGYFFGNLPLVRRNFSLVIMVIIVISVLPGIVKFLQERGRARRSTSASRAD